MREDSGMISIAEKARRENLCLDPLLLHRDFSGFEQSQAEGLNQDTRDAYPGVL